MYKIQIDWKEASDPRILDGKVTIHIFIGVSQINHETTICSVHVNEYSSRLCNFDENWYTIVEKISNDEQEIRNRIKSIARIVWQAKNNKHCTYMWLK